MRHLLPIVLACIVLAAAGSVRRPDSPRGIHRRVDRISAEVPTFVPGVAPIASNHGPSRGTEVRPGQGDNDFFSVRIEGMALDAETGLLVDGAYVRGVGCGVYGQEAMGSPRAGGGFEIRMTGGPRLEGTLLLSHEDYETEGVTVTLDRPWIVLSPIPLKPTHKRSVTFRGKVVDSVPGLPIDDVKVAVGVDGLQKKVPWHPANVTHDGGFQGTIALEPGPRGGIFLSAPGHWSARLQEVALDSPLVALGAVAMVPRADGTIRLP